MKLAASRATLPGPVDANPFPVWNPDTLRGLVGDNLAVHHRLLGKFLIHSENRVAEMTFAAANGDTGVVAGLAHSLKSASRSVGALALGELCECLEAAGRAGDLPQCRAMAARLADEFSSAAARINGHLGLKPRAL